MVFLRLLHLLQIPKDNLPQGGHDLPRDGLGWKTRKTGPWPLQAPGLSQFIQKGGGLDLLPLFL